MSMDIHEIGAVVDAKQSPDKQRPDLHALPVGTITDVEAHPMGWVVYFIEGHGKKVERPLDDRRVQREIAAALLRKMTA